MKFVEWVRRFEPTMFLDLSKKDYLDAGPRAPCPHPYSEVQSVHQGYSPGDLGCAHQNRVDVEVRLRSACRVRPTSRGQVPSLSKRGDEAVSKRPACHH